MPDPLSSPFTSRNAGSVERRAGDPRTGPRTGPHTGPHNGPLLGVLMLDTRFPRPPGDIGCAETFPFPVAFRTVPGAAVREIVAPGARAARLLPDFVAAARALEADGVAAITTSCGFLAPMQADLAAAVSVPVLTSALMIGPALLAALGGRRLGILTADAGQLGPEHLSAAGLDPARVEIAGLQDAPAFRAAILEDGPTLDAEALAREVAEVCRALRDGHPDLGGILFECTNLPPYAAEARAASGLPVWSILDAVDLMLSGVG